MTDHSEILKRVEQVEGLDIRRDGENRQYVYDALTGQMGVIAPQLAKDVRELLEEFQRMENAWRAEVERLRAGKPKRSRSTLVSNDFLSDLTRRVDNLREDRQKLIEALTEIIENESSQRAIDSAAKLLAEIEE